MSDFTFQTVGSILSKPGATTELGALMSELGASKVLVVTDPGVESLGLMKVGLQSLKAAGLEVCCFTEVKADPPEPLLLKAVEFAKTSSVDGVIGFGGGSSMDVAKLVAFLATSEQPIEQAYGVNNARGSRLPLIQVPTTAGTGSEVTPIAIITTGATEKKGVVSPILYCDWAVLDADLTLSLPANVTAATGIDAMVHALEAYTTKHKKNPISDTFALQALEKLGGNIRAVCADGQNREARAEMLLGSLMAGMAFSNAPCAAVHALAYPIGGHFHVPHGLSNALVLPHVLRFNVSEAKGMYADIAPIAMPHLAGQSGDAGTMSEKLIEGFESLMIDLKLENTLRQVGVSHNHLPKMAEDAMKQQRLLINNPREVGYKDALSIYEQAL